jgi:hypothetical protein
MTYKILVKTEAILDIAEAIDWYEEKQIGLGTEFLDELERYFDKITHHPLHYPPHRYLRVAVMQRFPYKIVFEIEESVVVVYAVYHHKRDPSKLSKRK